MDSYQRQNKTVNGKFFKLSGDFSFDNESWFTNYLYIDIFHLEIIFSESVRNLEYSVYYTY